MSVLDRAKSKENEIFAVQLSFLRKSANLPDFERANAITACYLLILAKQRCPSIRLRYRYCYQQRIHTQSTHFFFPFSFSYADPPPNSIWFMTKLYSHATTQSGDPSHKTIQCSIQRYVSVGVNWIIVILRWIFMANFYIFTVVDCFEMYDRNSLFIKLLKYREWIVRQQFGLKCEGRHKKSPERFGKKKRKLLGKAWTSMDSCATGLNSCSRKIVPVNEIEVEPFGKVTATICSNASWRFERIKGKTSIKQTIIESICNAF